MFQKYRNDYLDDDLFRSFQLELLKNPEAGDLIEGTGAYTTTYSAVAFNGFEPEIRQAVDPKWRSKGVGVALMRAVKAQFDPDGLLNPGKVLPPPDPSTPGHSTAASAATPARTG